MPRIHLAMHPPRYIKGGLRLAPRRREPTTPFRWPLDALGELAPRVLTAHEGERPSVDLGYASASLQLVPVLAANDGISLALGDGDRYAVSLDHSGTWSTHYTGLAKLAVIAGRAGLELRQSVRAGEVIGYTTGKLGFELWKWTDARGFVPVDPRAHLARWSGAPTSNATTSGEAA